MLIETRALLRSLNHTRYKSWILQHLTLSYFSGTISPTTPARQPHDSLHDSQYNSILSPVINGVRPTPGRAISRRSDIKSKGPKPMPLLKRKASWVEPDHVAKTTKQLRPREKKIGVIMYWHCHRIEEWSCELKRMVWRRPYYRVIKHITRSYQNSWRKAAFNAL